MADRASGVHISGRSPLLEVKAATPSPAKGCYQVLEQQLVGTESATSELSVKGGLTVFAVDYRGAGTPSMVLVDRDGGRYQLFKTIGAYKG